MRTDELLIDLFAGFGGASLGIRDAIGRDPDVAINHCAKALAVHAANHPDTLHLHGNVWHYAPREVTRGRPVGFLWASPTCTFFSQAKGGPLDRREASRVRALAWVVTRWAREARPRVIVVENVSQFQFWGPLANDGQPCPNRRSFTFRRWVRELERAGYVVEWRELKACDYGAPTTRNRLFVIARCDGQPIVWPEPTHGPGRTPYRGAAEIIDWSVPAPSIFGRKKPLVEATLRRVARGIRRFVLEAADPFIIPTSHGGDARVQSIDEPLRTITASSRSPFQLVIPYLVHVSNGERPGQTPRTYDIQAPLGTVVAGGVKHGLAFAFLAKNFGGHEGPGQALSPPLGTVTTRDHHALVMCSTIGDKRAAVRRLLAEYAPEGSLFSDADVRVGNDSYEIGDIGMRLLEPRELARAHDFGDELALEVDANGKRVTKTKQIALIGNSVARQIARAIVAANMVEEEAVAAE